MHYTCSRLSAAFVRRVCTVAVFVLTSGSGTLPFSLAPSQVQKLTEELSNTFEHWCPTPPLP
eukprot:998321-Rhodomonas_salina.1